VLRVGDRVRFDGATQTVVALSGTVVRLADEHGQGAAVALTSLFADPGFERLDGGGDRRALLAPGLLNGVPQEAVEDALWWEPHILEVLTGVRPDAPPGAGPARPTTRPPGPWRSGSRPRPRSWPGRVVTGSAPAP
jgi:hypothetical protein